MGARGRRREGSRASARKLERGELLGGSARKQEGVAVQEPDRRRRFGRLERQAESGEKGASGAPQNGHLAGSLGRLCLLGREENGRNVLVGGVFAAYRNVDEGGENRGDRDREQDGEAAEKDPNCEHGHEHE